MTDAGEGGGASKAGTMSVPQRASEACVPAQNRRLVLSQYGTLQLHQASGAKLQASLKPKCQLDSPLQ